MAWVAWGGLGWPGGGSWGANIKIDRCAHPGTCHTGLGPAGANSVGLRYPDSQFYKSNKATSGKNVAIGIRLVACYIFFSSIDA